MVCTVFVRANDYGVTVDEMLQNNYGHDVLAWYTSLGRDQRFLYTSAIEHMPEHGPFFEVLVAATQKLVGHDEWTTRAVVTGLAGVVGVIAVMLCGYVLGGEWLAFIAGLFLWGYPPLSRIDLEQPERHSFCRHDDACAVVSPTAGLPMAKPPAPRAQQFACGPLPGHGYLNQGDRAFVDCNPRRPGSLLLAHPSPLYTQARASVDGA
jgi:hypothetical protein